MPLVSVPMDLSNAENRAAWSDREKLAGTPEPDLVPEWFRDSGESLQDYHGPEVLEWRNRPRGLNGICGKSNKNQIVRGVRYILSQK